MNEMPALALVGLVGLALGAFFFGGLWWTTQKAVSSQRPALLFLVSLLLRMGMALAGIYLAGHADWRRLTACLTGFTVARFIALRMTCPSVRQENTRAREVSHAP